MNTTAPTRPRRLRAVLAALALAAAALLALTACSSNGGTEGSNDAAPAGDGADKTLTVAMELAYPPFETKDDAGNPSGVSVDFMKDFGAAYGYDVVIENTAFDGLIPMVQTGKADCLMSSITITDARKESVDFSDPYYTDQPPMVLVKKENVDNYQTMEDFSGKKVGAQMSTTKADIVSNDMPGANLVALSSVTDLVNELAYGKCDAIVINGKVALEYAAANEDLAVAAVSLGAAYLLHCGVL